MAAAGWSLQESCRTRTVTHSWWTSEVTYKDTWMCPSGYVSIGDETCYPIQQIYPDIPGGGSAPSGSTRTGRKSSTATHGPWEPHEEKWTERECRYEWRFHPFGGESEKESSVKVTPTHTQPFGGKFEKGRKRVRLANVDYIPDHLLYAGGKLAIRGAGATGKSAVVVNGRLLDDVLSTLLTCL